jgi:LPXTG-motif cell wall-anchored protein
MTGAILQSGGALLAVVLLIAGLSFLYRKRQKAPSMMKVVAYQSLGPKRGVAALKVGGEVLLLGVTQSECRLLKSLAEDEFLRAGSPGINDKINRLRGLKGEIGG